MLLERKKKSLMSDLSCLSEGIRQATLEGVNL